MPQCHGIQFFTNGICSLAKISGSTHKDICHILLGLIIGLKLSQNLLPVRLIRAVRGILDFLYLAQYPVHSTITLNAMDNALNQFHANKDIFIDLGIRSNFNLPKVHFCGHYRPLIEEFGTTDNTNTETTERLHIDFAKEAYRATNYKNTYPQMTLWLERKEKVLRHQKFIKWRLTGGKSEPVLQLPAYFQQRHIKMTKNPSAKAVSFTDLEDIYGARGFQKHLAAFVTHFKQPELTSNQALQASSYTRIPFFAVPVFHHIKFFHPTLHSGKHIPNTLDSVHVYPPSSHKQGKSQLGHFGTVLVKISDTTGPGVIGKPSSFVDLLY
jgi:hypothetical protein